MSDDLPVKPSTSGVQISWAAILRLLAWSLPVLATIAVVYLSSIFVTRDELQEAVEPMRTVPERVERLEEFRREHRLEQANSNAAIGAIQQDMAGIKAELRALQKESEKNTDRILQRLDGMQSKR